MYFLDFLDFLDFPDYLDVVDYIDLFIFYSDLFCCCDCLRAFHDAYN